MYLKFLISLILSIALSPVTKASQIANSQLVKIDTDIKYLALKTEGNYLVVINPNYLAKKEGANYAYFLDYHKDNITLICRQMNASVVFAADKVIHEAAVRYTVDNQMQMIPSEKAIDLVICKK